VLREMTLIEPWTTEWDFKVSVSVPDPITPERMGREQVANVSKGLFHPKKMNY
jgi:hypothetical protein